MPGYLFHFCAEWQKARKVLQLDSETLYDLASCIGEDNGDLSRDSIVVQQLGLEGWRLDVQAATEAGLLAPKLPQDELGGYIVGPNLILRGATMSNLVTPSSPRSPKSQAQEKFGFNRSQNLSKVLSSGPSTKSVAEHWYSNSANAPPVMRERVLFRNPSHHLAGLPGELSREDFVQEVRRRLISQRLFPVGAHQESMKEPVMSVDDAEDLFEALLLLQGRPDGLTLQGGRHLDAACDKFFALVRLRQLMERGATSLSTFFNMLDLGGRKGLEPSELKRFLKNVGGDFLSGMAAALAAEGVDVNRLAETLFTALDANKDAKVELWEMKRQLSLAAPPRMSLVEIVGHFEMKNGFGKSMLGEPKNRAQLFDHLSRKESLDFSPEDVARCFRTMAGGHNARIVHANDFDHFLKGMPLEVTWGVEPHAADQLFCAIGARALQLERIKQMDACLPAEAMLLSVEEAADKAQDEADMRGRFDRIWDRCVAHAPAFTGSPGKQLRDGCFRRLVDAKEGLKEKYRQGERVKFEGMKDSDLKKLAWALGAKDQDLDKVDYAQDKRLVLIELVLKLEKPLSGAPQPTQLQKPGSPAGRQQSGALPAIQQAASGTSRAAGSRSFSLPRSLFPNVSDVLVTASTQLHVGKACVVRYRLTGSCNFWGPNHEVSMNDRETIQWPCQRRLLGETPFIGLVPCGLNWSSGGGGGFYLGTQAFTSVDPNLRGDLPRDPTSGHSLLFGTVEIIPPSLVRTARTGFNGLSQEFELRLFCATKSKIIGCIGEPLMVTVIHQIRPPPIATLQVRCEGRTAVLRWSALELGPQARSTGVEAVRLHMKSEKTERCFSLEGDTSEWEVQDLSPDTEYEFRVRLENRAGPGREAVAIGRTNACCATPPMLTCAVSSTSYVDLRWSVPKTIGNESTRDRYQQNRESIECYEASLRIEDDEKDDRGAGTDDLMDELGELASASPTSAARKCQWRSGSWKEDRNGDLMGRLAGLRPDTRYALEAFCGINSMGRGGAARALVFWTVPQVPRIASVRVKNGQVLVALSQTGGVCVKEFEIIVSLTDRHSQKAKFELAASNLREDHEGSGPHPELTLPFEAMPPTESVKTHSISLRASNLGGWSEWSPSFEACAISRQQGADQAQLALIQATRDRKIDALTRLLAEVREIEFSDGSHVEKATELLKQLLAARTELNKTMQVRDPGPLLEALKVARKVQLPDIGKAEALLRKLEAVVIKLETSKGIDALRLALKAAHEARLPQKLLTASIERLGTREAAQQGLLEAMEAARVPGLEAALETSVGMNLPSEEEAQKLLSALQHSESLLKKAEEKALIVDLVAALRSAEETGLREDALIESARALLAELREKQEYHRSHIEGAMKVRDPTDLRARLDAAQFAQVLDKDMQSARALLEFLEGIIVRCEVAVGVEERRASLDAANAAEVPSSLLLVFEDQLQKLKAVHRALGRGSVEILRKTLKSGDAVGVKLVELAEAKVIYADWHRANHELAVSLSLTHTDRLRAAIKAALDIGIAQDQLDSACTTLHALEKRNKARARLEHCILRKNCEKLHDAMKTACDAEVQETEMLQEAHFLEHRLTQMRLDLAAAIETNDLRRVYDTYWEVSAHPALPEKERAKAKALLVELQTKEHDEINKDLSEARSSGKWRLLDYLVDRANRAASWGVQVNQEDIKEAKEVALELAEAQNNIMENSIMDQRLRRDCARWEHQVPESGESIQLPTGMVTGDLTVYFNAGGTYLATLPREIVEGKIVVPLEEVDMVATDDVEKTNVIANHLLTGLRKLLSPEDDIQRITQCIFDDDNRRRRRGCAIVDGRLEISFAVYVRAAHSGVEIAEALVERGHLGGDLWESDCGTFLVEPPPEGASASSSAIRPRSGGRPGRPLVREQPSVVAKEMASTLAQSLTERSLSGGCWAPGPRRVRRLCDWVTNVRPRVLRRVTVDLGWCYIRGLMDSLDATCLVFDQEQLVEIVDHRGYHGFRYGAGNGSGRGQTGPDATIGAVRHAGDVMDDEHRTGKQVMQVRLDLMPKRITDLVFVLSAYNSRDLSKFSDLNAVILDMDGAAELASAKVPSAGAEAFVMCSLYRLSDGLWRANSLMTPCKGTARDYRPVLARLSELGYPRNVSMRDQVAPLLKGTRTELSLDRAVKAAGVTVGPENTMTVPYAIELFSKSLRGPALVEEISGGRFHHDVLVEALKKTPGGERFSEKHVVVHPPSTKDFRDARLEMQWNYPSLPKHLAMTDDMPPQEENFLDATCMVFEGQALREIVDYRGAHGVRIVHNGVLDYGGVWAGKVSIGDATGGAVWHAGAEMDNASRMGKQFMEVRLDLMPRAATDLFFALSVPTNREVSRYTDVQARLIDGTNPGHEICSAQWNQKPGEEKRERNLVVGNEKEAAFKLGSRQEPWEAVILCSLSRATHREHGWHLVSYGCVTQGNASDYRPMILCLRAIQANRYPKPPPWPHQVKLEEEVKEEREAKDKQALMLPDLPQAIVLKRGTSSDESDCSSSEPDEDVDGNMQDHLQDGSMIDIKGSSSMEKAAGFAGSLWRSMRRRTVSLVRTDLLSPSPSENFLPPVKKHSVVQRHSAHDNMPQRIPESAMLVDAAASSEAYGSEESDDESEEEDT